MGGAHHLHKAPGPAGSTAGIKAGSAPSLFQAKCYKLLYSNSTVTLRSREKEKTKPTKKPKSNQTKIATTKPENTGKRHAWNRLFQLQLLSPGFFFFHFISQNFLYDQLQHNLEVSYTSSLHHSTVATLTSPLLY